MGTFAVVLLLHKGQGTRKYSVLYYVSEERTKMEIHYKRLGDLRCHNFDCSDTQHITLFFVMNFSMDSICMA